VLIGLMSDSHDNMPLIRQAVEYFNNAGVDLVLHAGDYISPICARELKNLKARMIGVFGNNDGDHNLWRERLAGLGEIHDKYFEAEYAGHKLLMMHDPFELDDLAVSRRYSVIVYGHTHLPMQRVVGETLVVNPGECGGWLTGKSSVALLELPSKKVTFVTL